MYGLELRDLRKDYKGKAAVDGVSYSFTEGVYGLLGANGAGKTTLLRMLCAILKPSDGAVYCGAQTVDEMDGEYRRILGYLPQEFGYYPDMTAERFLKYLAELKAMPADLIAGKIDELLALVELGEVRRCKIKTYSGGMLRRLGIAQAMLNDPEILILDEPTAGLDPKERIRFRNIISHFSKGRIVILSTHIVSDVEYIADQVLLMKAGRLLCTGTPAELTAQVRGSVWECRVDGAKAARLEAAYVVSNLKNEGEQVILRIVSGERPTAEAVTVEPTLEDVYLYHFGGEV